MDSSKLCCVFFPDDPAVCPYYAAIINLSCEYSHVLSPVSPSESLSEGGLGDPGTGLFILL